MKLGVELFSIRNLCGEDLEKGLKVSAEIGYEGVEFAGFFGHSAEEVAGWLKKYHLEVISAHVPAEEIFDHTDETIAYHKALGNKRIICPWADMQTAADVRALAARFRAVEAKFREAGMVLGYHNHMHEFESDEGKHLLDLLAEELPELNLQLDVYWVYRGGEDPAAYLEKYASRNAGVFHAKNGTEEGGTLAKDGNVDFEKVMACAERLGLEWAIVESESSDTVAEQVDAIAQDYTYLRSLMK